MADVIQTFVTDDRQAQAALLRQQRETIKLREEVKRLNSESRQGSSEFSAGSSRTINELKGMVAGFASVGFAVQAVRQAYADWRADMAEIAAETNKLNQSLIRNINTSVGLAGGKRAEAFLGSLSGVTREQGQAAFFGVTGGAPSISVDKQEALTRAIAPLALLAGGDSKELGRMGNLAGSLAEATPGLSPGDVVDAMQSLSAAAGDRVGELQSSGFVGGIQRLVSSGALGETEALGLGQAILQAELAPKLMDKIGAAATEQIDIKAPKSRGYGQRPEALSEEDLARNAFASLSPRERVQAILSDPATAQMALGAGSGYKAGAIPWSSVQAATGSIEADLIGNRRISDVNAAMSLESGQRAAMSQTLALEKDRMAQQAEGGAMIEQLYQEGYQASLKGASVADRLGSSAAWLMNFGANGGDRAGTLRGIASADVTTGDQAAVLNRIADLIESQNAILQSNQATQAAGSSRSRHSE